MRRRVQRSAIRIAAVLAVYTALALVGQAIGFNTTPFHWGGLTPSDVAAVHDHGAHDHGSELIDGHHVKAAPPMANTQAMGTIPCTLGFAGPFPCQNVDLMAFLPTNSLSGGGTGADIWGWTDPVTGREFAIQSHSTATSFVEVTNPAVPIYVGSMPASLTQSVANVLWRDVKVYADHAYVVGDGYHGSLLPHGLEIFDLTQLLDATPGTVFAETAHYGGFANGHNFVINEDSGIGYAVGTNTCAGGLHVLDLAMPTDPQFLGCVDQDGYTHDAQCVTYDGPDTGYHGREICFNSNEDTLTIFDVTPLITGTGEPVMLSRETYDGYGYTHQGWLTPDSSRFVLGDELDEGLGTTIHNTYSYVWNVEDLNAPVLIETYVGPTTAIDHNIYIKDGYVYEANYTAGLRILDASNIASGELTQVAYFDTHPSNDATNFAGSWSSYPYFASGTIVVSNIEDGLFVLKANLPGSEVVEPTGGGKVTGGGWLATDAKKLNFGFTATSGDGGFEGELTLNDKSAGVKIRIDEITAIGGLTGSCGAIEPGPDAVEFHGSGTYNDGAASFRVCAEDNGEGNNASGADRFVLECLEGCGAYTTSNRSPGDELDGGNIQVHEEAGASGSASVLILDPMLETSSPAGAAQLLDVRAFDARGHLLSGASVQLTSLDATGVFTVSSGVTGVDGVVTFSTVAPIGDTEYTAVSGELTSNTIEITGIG